MNRRWVLGSMLGWAAPASTLARAAGAPAGNRRLGVLLFDRAEGWLFLAPDLRVALAELGWVEGTNLSVDWRFADGDASRLPVLAAQLVQSGVDAVLTRGTPATRALQRATTTIPIVTGVGDPLGGGFARSHAQPGSNITGVSYAMVETNRKQVELLRGMVPGLARLVVVLPADRASFAQEITGSILAAAATFGLACETVLVAGIDDLPAALRPDRGPGVGAARILGFGTAIDPKAIARVALSNRVPTVFDDAEYVEAGGLMSFRLYWENQTQTQRTAAQLDQVFRGVRPGQIPFELPTRSEFVVNRATAKALGIVVPPAILLRADRVVE